MVMATVREGRDGCAVELENSVCQSSPTNILSVFRQLEVEQIGQNTLQGRENYSPRQLDEKIWPLSRSSIGHQR